MKSAEFKTSGYLKTNKDVVAYVNAALEDGEPAALLEALRNVAQTKGDIWARLRRPQGASSESPYRTLSPPRQP